MWTLLFMFGWHSEPQMQQTPFFETKEACVQAANQTYKTVQQFNKRVANRFVYTCVSSK